MTFRWNSVKVTSAPGAAARVGRREGIVRGGGFSPPFPDAPSSQIAQNKGGFCVFFLLQAERGLLGVR